jgi:hypothetical protein
MDSPSLLMVEGWRYFHPPILPPFLHNDARHAFATARPYFK